MRPSPLIVFVPLLLGLASGGAPLRFGPDAGSVLVKVFELELDLDFEEMTSRLDGQDVPKEYLPEMDIQIDTSERQVVRDEYVAVADGKPTTLRRTFEELDAKVAKVVVVKPYSDFSGEFGATSELEGRTVVFTLAGGEFEREFDSQGGDSALLEGLSEDMDLRALLPDDDVAEGDDWSIEPEAFDLLLRPGGSMAFEYEGGEDEWAFDPLGVEGELEARLDGEREVDGVQLAVVSIRGRVVKLEERATDLTYVPVADGTATETSRTIYDLTGEFLWDTGAGHVHSLELEADVHNVVVTMKDEGQEGPDFESTLTMTGHWMLTVSTEGSE